MHTIKTLILSTAVLSLAGLVGISIRLLALGGARLFVNDFVVRPACRLILLLLGIELSFDKESISSVKNNLIVFNHNSFLDVFIIMALPLQKAIPLVSVGTKKFLPLYLCNLAIGSFLVPLKTDEKKREDFFKNTTKSFKTGAYNLVSSPEGVHLFTKRISKFNSEIFVMAIKAKKDTNALFIKIPPQENPFETFCFKPTTVEVECLGKIKTSTWTQNDLKENIYTLRKKYMTYNKKFLGGLDA